MLAAHYSDIRLLHIGCAALSGALFTLRAVLRINGSPQANRRALRLASYVIDSTLLLAAVLLMLIVHQYPFVNGWLTAKVLLLCVYILLGLLALKWTRTTLGRSAALVGALAAFGTIVAVAVAHHSRGG
jgi:uncharacterized membrane protein SirB2